MREAVTQLAVVGYDQVIGYLEGGMATWQEAELAIQTLNSLTVEQLHTLRHNLHVLDVRDEGEWDEGHIKDALHVPYYFIEQRLQEQHNGLEQFMDQPLAHGSTPCGNLWQWAAQHHCQFDLAATWLYAVVQRGRRHGSMERARVRDGVGA